jgi:sRNA-binding protein
VQHHPQGLPLFDWCRKLYAQEKARLEERRELEAQQQQQEQEQHHGEQQDEADQQQLQQWPGPQPSPQQQLQPAKSPTLVVPDNNVVQHTEVEVGLHQQQPGTLCCYSTSLQRPE